MTATCTVGFCDRPSTRRIEVRRAREDEHPAEVRPICASKMCLRLAHLSGRGFSLTVKKGA